MAERTNRCKPEEALQRLETFSKTYLSQTDLSRILGISSPAILKRRTIGTIPMYSFVIGKNTYVWEKETIKQWLTDWCAKRRSESLSTITQLIDMAKA